MTPATQSEDTASEGRALMTDREREILSGKSSVEKNYEYKVKSIVRNRVRNRLKEDMEILEDNLPDVYGMVQEDVCGVRE